MAVEHPARLHQLVATASELPPGDREAFLRRECREDVDLRAAVELMLHDASPSDDFLERPALPISISQSDGLAFAPGNILASRFQIVRFLGSGGMGEVYEAQDLELGTAVALKSIRSRLATDERFVTRFREEVLQARAVAHPNVCRVFDTFTHECATGAVRFLTMELLPGRTVAEHLASEGPFALREAARVARQVASALDEAHRRQIVHRDLKPANVMLVPEEDGVRAVVTDFGLSVRLEHAGDSILSASAREAGTEDYVAPEQRRTGTVGPAADVYAFGVLLHEMLTGRPPRSGEVASELPARCRDAIARCLSDDPAKRPRSASDVVRFAFPPDRRLRAASMALLVIAVMVALSALYFRFTERGGFRKDQTVVVADAMNETGEADLNGLTEMLRFQVSQSPLLHVLDQTQVSQTLTQMVAPQDTPLSLDQARELAWRRDADIILSARVRGHAPSYVLTARFERRGGEPDVVGPNQSRSFEARDRDDLQRAVRDAARWIRTTAGEPASDIPRTDRPVEDVTSNSWEAVALFSRGQRLAAQGRQRDALALFQEAVGVDPDFALAWMRMGDILMSRRSTAEGYACWAKAIEAFRRRKLTTRESLRIRGMYASDTDDHAEAERVFRLYLLTYPDDFTGYFYIARPLLMLGRTDEAIDMLRVAGEKDPSSFSVPAQLAMFQLRAGRVDDAAAHIATLRRMGQQEWADCIEGQLAFLRGSYSEALAKFHALERASDPLLRSRSASLQASVLAERGQNRAALDLLRTGAAADAAAGDQSAQADKLIATAAMLVRDGRIREGRDACVLAQQVDRSPVRRARCAVLLAQGGFVTEAAAILDELPRDNSSRRIQADRFRITAEMLLARKRPLEAWRAFQQAASLEAPGVLCEYLARGAAAAGEAGTALAIYEGMARDPGYFWRYPDNEPPGAWRAAMTAYLRLAHKNTRRVDVSAVTASLQRLGGLTAASRR